MILTSHLYLVRSLKVYLYIHNVTSLYGLRRDKFTKRNVNGTLSRRTKGIKLSGFHHLLLNKPYSFVTTSRIIREGYKGFLYPGNTLYLEATSTCTSSNRCVYNIHINSSNTQEM